MLYRKVSFMCIAKSLYLLYLYRRKELSTLCLQRFYSAVPQIRKFEYILLSKLNYIYKTYSKCKFLLTGHTSYFIYICFIVVTQNS